jgi:hypothetical protein
MGVDGDGQEWMLEDTEDAAGIVSDASEDAENNDLMLPLMSENNDISRVAKYLKAMYSFQ